MSRRLAGRPVLAPEAGRRVMVIPAIVLGAVLFLLAAPAAMAHGGIESGQSPWTAWNTNPLPTILLLVAAYFYMNGLANWDRPSHPVNNWQKLSFFSGLFLIFIALQSPVDPIADHMLSVHQVQHFLLRMMAPLLILLGAPLTPMLRGLPPWALKRIVKPLVRHPRVRRAYFWLTNPIVTTGLFMGSLYLWQFPGAFNLALQNDVVHALMHLTMSGSGFLFWWIVIDPKPHHSRLHYGLRVLYLGLIILPNTILGCGNHLLRWPALLGLCGRQAALRRFPANRPANGRTHVVGPGRHDERGRGRSGDGDVVQQRRRAKQRRISSTLGCDEALGGPLGRSGRLGTTQIQLVHTH